MLPAPPKDPPRACAQCGRVKRHEGLGLCSACWQHRVLPAGTRRGPAAEQAGGPGYQRGRDPRRDQGPDACPAETANCSPLSASTSTRSAGASLTPRPRAWTTPPCGGFTAPASARFASPSAARQPRSCSTRAAERSSKSPNGPAAADDGPLIDREDLLWGLLADASSESVTYPPPGNVDLGRLWTDLQRWHRSA